MVQTGVVRQFLATITCNILSQVYGSSCSWGGPNFLVLTSQDTPLKSGPLSTSEGSLTISMPCFGAIIGTALFSCIIDRFGRKTLLIFIAVSQLLSWVAILLATNVYHLYMARFIGGMFGAALLVTIPAFTSEIADDKIRGTLSSLLVLSCNIGTVFGFVIANNLDYYEQIKANIMLPILFLVLINFFPETPEYLLKRNQRIAAEKSRNFYRGIKSAPSIEMKRLNEQDTKTYERIEQQNAGLSLSDFCSPAARKATAIAIFCCILNQISGVFAMMNYTNKIFEDAGSTLPSNTASIIVASVQLVANCITMVLVDRAGRKILITFSAILTALGHICMGLNDLYKEQLAEFKWISIASFSMIIFMASIGVMPLTFVILSEILPKKIKNMVTLLSLEVMWILAFVMLSFYPALSGLFGIYNCFFFFAACCIIGAVFYITVLPETKGKSYDEIIKALEK